MCIGKYQWTMLHTKKIPCFFFCRLQNNQKDWGRNIFRGGENSKCERWEILRLQNHEADNYQVFKSIITHYHEEV
jgi:hypothetical protein